MPADASSNAPATPFTPLASTPGTSPTATVTSSTVETTGTPAPEKPLVTALLERKPQPPPPFQLARTTDKPRVAPEVAAGYEQLVAGNVAAARSSYAQAVAANPTDLDARLGLATVEARSGNRAAAIEQYGRALDIDPRNATALAGLAAVTDFSNPDALESQVRSDVSRYPRSAALHFTLGNLYAAQSRWGEAQAEYYEAYRLEPGSADILYNLAVSLDHLGQKRLAAENYARALEAAKARRGQFDSAAVARRLAELRP
jgi:tetratricopeptide (TPR) repeat protein